jgi:hypothetical protein
MQFVNEDIEDSVEYPLQKICDKLLRGIKKGDLPVKYFTSSFAYEMALALYEGFERIEIYGFDMSATDEFAPQKACAEFWIGMALGMGVEIYLPPECQLISGILYAYQGLGPSNLAVEPE